MDQPINTKGKRRSKQQVLVYLAPKDEDQLYYQQLIASLPAHLIRKCKMDVSILVMLTVEKYLYHMPVWRQQRVRPVS